MFRNHPEPGLPVTAPQSASDSVDAQETGPPGDGTQGPPGKPGCATRLLHLTTLLLLFCFLVIGVDGNFPIKGDDVAETQISPAEMLQHHNLLDIYQARSGLRLSYYSYRHYFAGGSFSAANLFTWLVYGCSAILFYFVLGLYFSPTVSWLGSLLYLSHCAKFEVMIWFAASMYVPVMILFMLTLWLLQTGLAPLLKGFCIGLAGWVSMLWYEVFVTIVPFYVIMMVGQHYVKTKRIYRTVVLGSLIPGLFVLLHIMVLAGAANPIWNRSMIDADYRSLSPAYRIWKGFSNTLDATIGVRHANKITDNVLPFFRYYVFEQPLLLFLLAAVLTLGIVLTSIRRTNRESAKPPAANTLLIGVAGAYLLLFSGITAFVVGVMYTPSRLTCLPSIGLFLVVCAVLELIRDAPAWSNGRFDKQTAQKSFAWATRIVLTWSLVEAIAFASIVRQNLEVYQFDKSISDQIHQIYPRVQGDEVFFVNLPVTPKTEGRIWREAHSSYQTGRAMEWLWYRYGVDFNTLDYVGAVRRPENINGSEMRQALEDWGAADPNRVVPFYIDDQWVVRGIRQITVLAGSGQVVKTLYFPSHQTTPDNDLVIMTLLKESDSYRLLAIKPVADRVPPTTPVAGQLEWLARVRQEIGLPGHRPQSVDTADNPLDCRAIQDKPLR